MPSFLTLLPKFVVRTAVLGALLVAGAHAAQPVATGSGPVVPVAALDVPRYMGKWYEIAHFPNWFQKKCVDSTHAEYTLQPNGRVRVVNRCRLASGEMNEAVGEARQVGEGGAPHRNSKCALPRRGCLFCRWCGATIGFWIWMPITNWWRWASPRANTCGCWRARHRCRSQCMQHCCNAWHNRALM